MRASLVNIATAMRQSAKKRKSAYDLPIEAIPSTRFHYDSKKNTLSAESSDLGDWHMSRLFEDAADFGIAIFSARTNRVVRFYESGVERSEDGILVWRFKPLLRDCSNEQAKKLEVVIFND